MRDARWHRTEAHAIESVVLQSEGRDVAEGIDVDILTVELERRLIPSRIGAWSTWMP